MTLKSVSEQSRKWSNSDCLNHNLSYTGPNEVIQISVKTRHLGEQLS